MVKRNLTRASLLASAATSAKSPTWPLPNVPAPAREAVFDFDHWHDAVSAVREKQIFFIGGSVKSGTTWLQLLLNAHPEVSANGEGHFLDLLAPALRMAMDTHGRLVKEKNEQIFRELGGYPRLSEDAMQYVIAGAIQAFLVEQSKHKAARAVGEKTPDNLLHFPKLKLLFPRAKFIQIIRDGRDCAVSAWFHNLRTKPEWAMSEFGSVEAFACKYADHWSAELAAAQAFADRHPGHVRQVQYEKLVASTEPVLSELFRFLGVNASDAMTALCRAAASFAKLSGGRNPGEEDRGSFFRKGVPGDWRNYLGSETSARFVTQAGAWLHRFGYA
jgi:hypothetical protein